jgi:light-regulated signal transduction histidine kinase (bacteriophytochrome)
VDDNEIGRYARTRFLNRAGFNVLEADNGLEALRIARQNKPDLVLLDINMPGMSGLDVCRQLRADPDTERLPVIFVSASRLADPDVVEGLDAGADNYLREPVDPSVLVAAVRALLRARQAEDELARANEQLRRFAFIVSHELQEPLRIVRTHSQLLERRCRLLLDDESFENIDFIVKGTDRMATFIRDMLAYSQSVEGNLNLERISLKVPLDMALVELEMTIRDAGARVTSDVLPVWEMDSMRISQVFRNLIVNGIKYRSPERAPHIHVSAVQAPRECVVTVADNGLGIEQQYAEQVFVLFKRLHGREKSGSGVGLAICKQIVEQHGGEIWVESLPGKGSKFKFTLPGTPG